MQDIHSFFYFLNKKQNHLFIYPIDDSVGICAGHISLHASDFEHPAEKCFLYSFLRELKERRSLKIFNFFLLKYNVSDYLLIFSQIVLTVPLTCGRINGVKSDFFHKRRKTMPTKKVEIPDFQKEVNALVEKAKVALREYEENYDQEKIDYIVAKCSVAALDKHGVLAKEALDETRRRKIFSLANMSSTICAI